MERLISHHEGRRVLVFTCGGFIAAACHHLMGLPWRTERDPDQLGFFLDPAHTGITEWFRPSTESPWVLVRYNDTAHMEP